MSGRFYEDLVVGATFRSEPVTLSEKQIIEFAREWDPQPWHIDPVAARDSAFGRLVGSGMHTTVLVMRMFTDMGLLKGTALAGLGFDTVRFRQPLLAGDPLSVLATVTEKRPTRRPDRGVVTIRLDLENAQAEVIFTLSVTSLVATRQGRQRASGAQEI